MAFGNPVVAGGILQVPAIESLGYIAGAAGWIIERNGDAEFNDLTIRGKFEGTDFEITSAGVFFYSAAPANGDLVISLAFTAGTDPYGNVYPAGLQILNHGGSNASGIAIGYAGTQPLQYFLNAVANMQNDPAFIVNTSGSGTAEFASFVISGGEDATQKDYVAISFDSSSQDGTSHVAQIQDAYIDPSAASHPLILRGPGGVTIYALAMAAIQPGTGTSRTNVAAGEVWHVATLGTGWSAVTGLPPLQYRVTADGDLQIMGCVQSSSATPSATVFTLPTGWAPAANTRVGGVVERNATADVTHSIAVNTSGAVILLNNIAASGVALYWSVEISLNPHS